MTSRIPYDTHRGKVNNRAKFQVYMLAVSKELKYTPIHIPILYSSHTNTHRHDHKNTKKIALNSIYPRFIWKKACQNLIIRLVGWCEESIKSAKKYEVQIMAYLNTF